MSLLLANVKQPAWQVVYTILIFLYSFSLPVSKKINSILFIALVAFWLCTVFKYKEKYKVLFQQNAVKALAVYIALLIVSMLLSVDKNTAIKYLTLHVSIFVLPFVFYKRLNATQLKYTLQLFVFGTLISTVWAIYQTYTIHFDSFTINRANLEQADWAYFSYMLPNSINFNAPYFSLYVCSSLFITTWQCIGNFINRNKIQSFLWAVISLYLLLFTGVLASRSALIFTILILSVCLLVWAFQSKRYILLAAILFLVPLVSVSIVQKVPYLQDKIRSSAGLKDRVTLWENGMQVIKSNLILGTGIGDNDSTVIDTYQKNGFATGVENELNLHNQFIETTVAMGMIGFFVLLGLLFIIFRTAYLNNNFILLCFISVFSLCSLTESLLEGRAGVVLFSFFISLLITNPINRYHHFFQINTDESSK